MSFRKDSGFRACVFGAALVVAAAAGLARGIEDTVIKYKNNEAVHGEIKKADLTNVDMEMKDPRTQAPATVSIPTAEIADIKWDVSGVEWQAAMNAYEGAQYANAAKDFLGITNDQEELERSAPWPGRRFITSARKACTAPANPTMRCPCSRN